jgi:hypothetical protein
MSRFPIYVLMHARHAACKFFVPDLREQRFHYEEFCATHALESGAQRPHRKR